MRVTDEHAEHQLDTVEDIIGGDVLGLLVADQLAEAADALGQRCAQPGLMRAPVRSRDGVAVVTFRSVGIERPGNRPFGATLAIREILATGEGLVCDSRAFANLLG